MSNSKRTCHLCGANAQGECDCCAKPVCDEHAVFTDYLHTSVGIDTYGCLKCRGESKCPECGDDWELHSGGMCPPPNDPHASDCARWVSEPCDCVYGMYEE